MNKITISCIAVAVISVMSGTVLMAQDLNTTVEVTRSYEGKIVQTQKPQAVMAVPDSVRKFNLAFDYSVFDNPYKGANEFDPYLIDFHPQTGYTKSNLLYLRAGAGFGFHPTVDFVLSPRTKSRLKYNVYLSNRSFIGDYKNISARRLNEDSETYALIDNDRSAFDKPANSSSTYFGYDINTRGGLAGRVDWNKAFMDFKVGYRGIQTKDDYITKNAMNGVEASFRLAANAYRPQALYFDVNADYMFAGNSNIVVKSLLTHDFNLNATVGPVLTNGTKVLADLYFGLSDMSGIDGAPRVMSMAVTPRYVRTVKRWRFDVGLKFAYNSLSLNSGDAAGFLVPVSFKKGYIVYPDIEISYEAVRGHLNMFVRADGGPQARSYTQLRERNHFFNLAQGQFAPVISNEIAEYVVAYGIEGNVASKFKYTLKVGGSNYQNKLMDAVMIGRDGDRQKLYSSTVYRDAEIFFASADLLFSSHSWDLALGARYEEINSPSVGFGYKRDAFYAPPLSGYMNVGYNIKKRIFFRVYAEGAVQRLAYASVMSKLDNTPSANHEKVKIPGYVDLGLQAEFAFNRRLSVWVEADNILGMPVQRIPLYCETPFSFTAGICLNL